MKMNQSLRTQELSITNAYPQRKQFCASARRLGGISLFERPEWSPSKSNAGRRHAKAEASFAHSKRCREVRLLLQTLRLRPGPRCHDARSVWSARSLLPLCDKTSKTIGRAIRSPRGSSPPKSEVLPGGWPSPGYRSHASWFAVHGRVVRRSKF